MTEQVLSEDVEHHLIADSPQNLVAWKKFHDILSSNLIKKDKAKDLPQIKIKGIEMAKHSLINFDELLSEGPYPHRYLLC